MPTSSYQSFDVTKRGADGAVVPLPGITVKVYDATNNANLPNLTTDINGIIAAGTFNVAAGTRIIFRIENYQGSAGSITQITT